MPWEDVKSILRPDFDEEVHMGIMEVDKSKCTKCGLCIQNCPFLCWKEDEEGFPVLKEEYACFSCYNCTIPCPVDAVKTVATYHVHSGFWKTHPDPLPAKLPLEPKDAEGNPTEWNEIEKLILERRSVRNFKDKPVPESLIQRVLEAGRFAPSAGNCQPWKFIVITNKAIIQEIEQKTTRNTTYTYNLYTNDEEVKKLEPWLESGVGSFDPRLAVGGMSMIAKPEMGRKPAFNAPVLILLAADTRAIGGTQLNIGICGQNMNLVANSLGIKALWNGFVGGVVNGMESLKKRLGLKEPWTVVTALCLGYPKFKQDGMVPREFRPITWFREGKKEIEIQK